LDREASFRRLSIDLDMYRLDVDSSFFFEAFIVFPFDKDASVSKDWDLQDPVGQSDEFGDQDLFGYTLQSCAATLTG
jgi:hypothetical protein